MVGWKGTIVVAACFFFSLSLVTYIDASKIKVARALVMVAYTYVRIIFGICMYNLRLNRGDVYVIVRTYNMPRAATRAMRGRARRGLA